ncbi:hypothetical protein SAY87_016605 [Trapa incisa]|uniref:Fatty acyl-CoA reductase C-terminal domain-containing protein n=1 Tax=Trapa incisa TaxID=236973 RepID=A0AAN7QUH9_9MYRT|nr:hypothetical protein SAY87_016605 [Trapa incisa]
MAAHAGRQLPIDDAIYHVGSSFGNPVRYSNLHDYGYGYFSNHPWINKDGKAVIVGKVTILRSMASFRRYMGLRYLLLLKGLEVATAAFCRSFQRTYHDMNRKINIVMRLVELYRPYLFFKGVFNDTNTEKLRSVMKEKTSEADIFYFDPKCINWDDYFTRIHLVGLVKYVFKLTFPLNMLINQDKALLIYFY